MVWNKIKDRREIIRKKTRKIKTNKTDAEVEHDCYYYTIGPKKNNKEKSSSNKQVQEYIFLLSVEGIGNKKVGVPISKCPLGDEMFD